MTTNALTDVFTNRQNELDNLMAQLSADAASKTLDDRLRITDAMAGLNSQMYNQGSLDRQEARNERVYQAGYAQQNFDNNMRAQLQAWGMSNDQIDQLIRIMGLTSGVL
jgi:hypothetical protein